MGKKNAAKMLDIKKMMKGGASAAPAGRSAAAKPGLGATSDGTANAPPAKRSRPEMDSGDAISGDILEDNFIVESFAPGDEGGADALDGGSDAGSDDDMDRQAAASKKRKHDTLKAKKRAKAGAGPTREDSLTIAAASAEAKADIFLVCAHLLAPSCRSHSGTHVSGLPLSAPTLTVIYLQKHFRASDTGGKMSAVETTDYVSSEHFLSSAIALESIGVQLSKLCPECATGPAKSKGGASVAAPFVAVLVSSSEVCVCV